jgi:hypothetical protein
VGGLGFPTAFFLAAGCGSGGASAALFAPPPPLVEAGITNKEVGESWRAALAKAGGSDVREEARPGPGRLTVACSSDRREGLRLRTRTRLERLVAGLIAEGDKARLLQPC